MKVFPLVLALAAAFILIGCEGSTVQGPEGQSLSIVLPSSLTVHRGQTAVLEVEVWRKNFTGPVTVSISQLPPGVSVPEYSQTMETDKVAFIITASDTADLVGKQQIKIIATGPAGVQSTQYTSLTVK